MGWSGWGLGKALQSFLEPQVCKEPLLGVVLCWTSGLFQMWVKGSLRT